MNVANFLLLLFSSFFSQGIPELSPTLGKLIDKSSEGAKKYAYAKQLCASLNQKVSNAGVESLSQIDQNFYNTCDDYLMSYWDVLGPGDNWYDAGKRDTQTATSKLPAYKGISYSAANAHDLNYQTAWVEGVKGYGIGEKLTYRFPADNPRITEVIVVNGYVKSLNAWRDNSRVKKLKMYFNGKPLAILSLHDGRQEQKFSIEPLGHGDRENIEALRKLPSWTLTFEILEVYPGLKYDDTAITEIYFDGIDVY